MEKARDLGFDPDTPLVVAGSLTTSVGFIDRSPPAWTPVATALESARRQCKAAGHRIH